MTHADLDALKAANPTAEVAARYVRLRRAGQTLIGPCPICGGSTRNGRFEVRPDTGSWMCAVCQDGGDVITLVQKVEGVDFRTAVERLGGTEPESEESRRRREAVHARRRQDQEAASARWREDERRRVHKLWLEGRPIAGTAVEAYLAARRLTVPAGAHLRALADVPLFGERTGDGPPPVLHCGPAMLAAITGPDRRFAALHTTWVDPGRPGRKIEVANPTTGELEPAKKVRGSKKGGHIALVRHPAPTRLFIGEGIETVLSVWCALVQLGSPLLEGAAFWTSVDLGNLGGPAAATIAHPVLKTPAGRPRRIPGSEPDFGGPAIVPPDSVRNIIILGDGDSEPVLTRTTAERAACRWSQKGRTVSLAMAPPGKDFNDIWRGVE